MTSFGFWDAALLVIVTSQATLLAYLPSPRLKAWILALPFPFTLATLALGTPVNASHVVGLDVLLAYTHAVRWLHGRLRLPIVPSIALSAAGYCGVSVLIRPWLPPGALAFWLSCGLTLLVALAAHLFFRPTEEPAHRSRLSPWVKLPILVAVISILILMKKFLQGFMAMFPMVGIFAAYEGRYSLRTICRTIPIFTFGMVPMLGIIFLVQGEWGLGPALGFGWTAFLVLLPLLMPHLGGSGNAAPLHAGVD